MYVLKEIDRLHFKSIILEYILTTQKRYFLQMKCHLKLIKTLSIALILFWINLGESQSPIMIIMISKPIYGLERGKG